MARPERRDADYFPFYAKDGRTLHILENKYGCKGTGFFTNVMRFLTLQENHFFCISNESDKLYFFSKCKCDEESGMAMLNIMSKTCKIHASLWVSYAVIASQDLLDSLFDAYRNRKNAIITIPEILKRVVSDTDNPQEPVVSDTDNPQEPVVSDTDNPQRKGKKRKVKKSKIFIPPTLEETKSYFKDNGYPESLAIKAWTGYSDADWHDTRGNKILAWKQKFRFVWFKDENKLKELPNSVIKDESEKTDSLETLNTGFNILKDRGEKAFQEFYIKKHISTKDQQRIREKLKNIDIPNPLAGMLKDIGKRI